jgi:NTE family protein
VVHEADAVFQGGGAKGLALVGAILEFADEARHPDSHVDRWVQVAGTSAGAAVAALLGAGFDAERLETALRTAPLRSFVDRGFGWGVPNLLIHHGLARGRAFRDWIDEQVGGWTFGDAAAAGRTVRMVAADTSRRAILVLPDDLHAYADPATGSRYDPDGVRLADGARMSMSLPFVFEPVSLRHLESGRISTIVDGGLVSNFPVWIFDEPDRDPIRPTFGFRMFGGRSVTGGLHNKLRRLAWPAAFGWDMFETAVQAWDRRFLAESTRIRTVAIDAQGVGTLDFDLSDERRAALADSGRRAAGAFLDQFDPAAYENAYGRTLADSV